MFALKRIINKSFLGFFFSHSYEQKFYILFVMSHEMHRQESEMHLYIGKVKWLNLQDSKYPVNTRGIFHGWALWTLHGDPNLGMLTMSATTSTRWSKTLNQQQESNLGPCASTTHPGFCPIQLGTLTASFSSCYSTSIFFNWMENESTASEQIQILKIKNLTSKQHILTTNHRDNSVKGPVK